MSQRVTRKRVLNFDDDDSSTPKRKPNSSYSLNDKVLCKHVDDGLFYEAKIIEVGNHGYTVHYKGWGKKYDEFFSDEAAKTCFKPFTEDAAIKAANELKEARKSVSTSRKKTPSRFKATKIEDVCTPSKKIKAVEKTPSNVKKNEEPFTPSTLKKVKTVEKSPSIAKEESISSMSNVKDTPLNDKETSSKKSMPKDVFSNLITKDLSGILCIENEYIFERNVFPKLPAKLSVEDIIKQFLESKQIEIDDRFENSIQGGDKFEYDTYESDSVMAFFLNIFNIAFPLKLVHNVERPAFDDILKKESEEKGDASQKKIRYSEFLGLSHLLRYITFLNDSFVDNILELNPAIANVFVDSVKELCVYLDKNISKFYNEDEYYKMDV